MNKEIVPYEEALALKELGFDESCLGWFKNTKLTTSFNDLYSNPKERGKEFKIIKAPTFSQAFRWFREKYKLFVQPNRTIDSPGIWYYFSIETRGVDVCEGSFIYEEAEIACLKKLIKIAKQGGNT